MLVLPHAISVKVVAEDGAAPHDLLVSLSIRYEGRDYYNTSVGLTNADGTARRLGSDLAVDFRNDQLMWLMDYRVPLAQCDAIAGVEVPGEHAYLLQRAAGEESGLATPETQRIWAVARNALVTTARGVIALDQPDAAGVVHGVLAVRPAPRGRA